MQAGGLDFLKLECGIRVVVVRNKDKEMMYGTKK